MRSSAVYLRSINVIACAPYAQPHGAVADLLVLAHEFSCDMLAGLVLAGLATVVTETIRAGGPTIKVERYRITDAGTQALEG